MLLILISFILLFSISIPFILYVFFSPLDLFQITIRFIPKRKQFSKKKHKGEIDYFFSNISIEWNLIVDDFLDI